MTSPLTYLYVNFLLVFFNDFTLAVELVGILENLRVNKCS